MPRFTHIAAMHSELVAISVTGHLCQWRWIDFEPFCSYEVLGVTLTFALRSHI
jgi:E3 ubiquitin-protein ligase EDD1